MARQGVDGREAEMVQKLVKLWKDEEGPTAVEYGLMVALIAAIIIVSVAALGTKVDATFKKVDAGMP